MTALRNPAGWVRGFVVGGHFQKGRVQSSRATNCRIGGSGHRTVPVCSLHSFQNRVCVGHAIQALTDLNPDSTVLSVDEIGAFHLLSRRGDAVGSTQHEGRRHTPAFSFPNSAGNLLSACGSAMRGSATPFLKGEGGTRRP